MLLLRVIKILPLHPFLIETCGLSTHLSQYNSEKYCLQKRQVSLNGGTDQAEFAGVVGATCLLTATRIALGSEIAMFCEDAEYHVKMPIDFNQLVNLGSGKIQERGQ